MNAVQPVHGGEPADSKPTYDAFVAKIGEAASAPLLNISTRLGVGTGENALIGGFIVTGSEAKKVIIRAMVRRFATGA